MFHGALRSAALSLLVATVVLLGHPLTAGAVAVSPSPESADDSSYTVLRQGYDLLLDRYYQPILPDALLGPGYQGVVKALKEAGVAVRSPETPNLAGGREQAFKAFLEALGKLLRESPAPAGFNASHVALQAMARALGEEHTFFMTPQDFERYIAATSGRETFVGIGIRLRLPQATIADVYPGSPAEAAGLRSGDVIVSVEGAPVVSLTLSELAQRIRGPAGTPVGLVVLRPSTGQTLEVAPTRTQLRVRNASARIVQDDIAYLQLLSFSDPQAIDQFEAFLDSPEAKAARGLVIDLRGNGGGRTDFGQRLLNRFIASGPLFVQVEHRLGWRRVLNAAGPGWQSRMPIAVLIDGSTASMGELFASAMQERGVGRLFGSRTSGIVAGGAPFGMSDGSGFQITVVDILSGNGNTLNRVGVAPDVQVETSPEDATRGRDTPLEAAVLYLWSRSAQAETNRAEAAIR